MAPCIDVELMVRDGEREARDGGSVGRPAVKTTEGQPP